MLLPDLGSLLLLVLWGGWVAVDGTSCGQFMISRPLVAATVAGWIMGDPLAGVLLGVVLEAFELAVLPVGAARFSEGGPPAVAAGALYAASDQRPATLLTVVAFALAWEWLSGSSISWMRQWNVRWFSFASHPLRRPAELERKHLAAVSLDFGRGMLLVGVGLLVLSAMLRLSRVAWGAGDRLPQAVVAAAVVALLAGSLRLFGARTRLFFAGVIGGLLFLLARQ